MTSKASAWARLPEAMKDCRQWVVAGASKAPLSLDAHGKMFNTAVTRPSEWMPFEKAAQLAWDNRELVTTHVDKKGRTITQVGLDIGFVLTDSDPFTCIDLDIKDSTTHPDEPELWATSATHDLYIEIYTTFDSYTERSRSGKGLHIWVEGDIGRGFRRDGVEVYSRERFIICTGDVLPGYTQIHDRQSILTNMVARMRPAPKEFKLEELPPEEDNWAVLERAFGASNSDKFIALWKGEWAGLGFPSQSEADLALMSMLTFYSPSNQQCRELFRESGLGKREKAQKNDRYLNATLTTIRQREEREQAADVHGVVQAMESKSALEKQQAAEAIAQIQGGAPAAAPPTRETHALHVVGQGDPVLSQPPAEVTAAGLAPISGEVFNAGKQGLPWPPGFAGTVAQFIYRSAPRPVKEVAIVAALGLLAGITGKAWHIPQSGLNLYIILIARSAIGKEAMHSGIGALIRACSRENPMFHKFIDFTDYASGPALIKACVANPCFVNVSGEWGRKLKRLAADERGDGPLQTLRTQMTNLYQKSGPQAIVGGIGYSSTDNNVSSVAGVSYSLIGETTPGTFYEALTETMMEDGFLSRFLVIEYEGERPESNKNPVLVPDNALKQALNNLATQADMLIAKDSPQAIGRDEESAAIMEAFELECDKNINSTTDESRRQMWNRAALKSLRIAGLLAVADNWFTPCITKDHILWAQDVVRRDIAIMRKRMETGDVGSGDNSREKKMVAVLKDYLLNEVPASYKVPDTMRQNSIVPRSYIQVRTARAAAFYNHKLGANRAVDETINAMIANGYLMEVAKDKVVDAYGYHGKSYRVLRLPDYEAESKH